MSVLWCGGEDIDFPVLGNTFYIFSGSIGSGHSGYNRNTISANSGPAKSLPFPGGAVTSAWLSARVTNTFSTSQRFVGVGLSSAGANVKGLYLGSGASSGSAVALYKYDGTTWTLLATEAGTSFTAGAKFDMQITNYGATATVNVYINTGTGGTNLVITYSGDVTVSGMTNFDCVVTTPSGNNWQIAEIMVADEDTRNWLGLLTMAPNANGTTQNWSNPVYTNYNPGSINDSNFTYVNATAQDTQCNLIDEPGGTYTVKMIKTAVRALATAGAATTNLKVGFNSGGTVAVGASHALTTTFATYEDYFTQNPVTSAPWGGAAEINALQLDMRSA